MLARLLWGDTHLNIRQRDREHWESSFEAARQHLDFLAVAYYPMDVYLRTPRFRVESWHNRPEYLDGWQEINQLCRKYNRAGSFVTFPGYEWHGDRTRWGDHNVFYRNEGNPLDDTDDIEELYANLRARDGLAIPHHVGYLVGQRGKDWDHFDPALSPVAEIFSKHGSSETAVNRLLQRNAHMGPWTTGGVYVDALARGLKVGAIASGDSHAGFSGVHGSGLAAVWTDEFSRDAIWQALKDRRAYGVTGDRIVVRYSVNDSPMGSEIESAGVVTARFQVICPQALDRIEWIRNGRVIKTYCHLDEPAPAQQGTVRCRVQIELGWGRTPSYGFDDTSKDWQGTVSVSSGRLSIVQGCWTDFGNRVYSVDDRNMAFEVRTASTEGGQNPRLPQSFRVRPTQPFIVEVDAPCTAMMTIDAAPFRETFDLDTAISRTQLWADLDGARKAIHDTHGLEPKDIENHDVYYHNAYKLRVPQAVPSHQFLADVTLTDPAPPEGPNWYYARISQVNGQMAWTSPVWVEQRA